MKKLTELKYGTLYRDWGILFAATALLGLLFPGAKHPLGLFALRTVTVLFFLPPWLILTKAKNEENHHHRKLIRYLSAASLAATVALFCCAVFALRLPEFMGTVIHVVMAILCAPLVCSNYYALPLFLWAVLLILSFRKNA